MKKSLLLASLMVITESAFGIHDHPRINSNQDHIVQNLTPISNIEVTPDRSSLNEWSDIETIDEGSYSGTPQRQNSSGSRKRISENELKKFTDKRRRIVTLQNIRNSLNAFSKGKMKEEEGTQTARDIWNIFQDIDSLNFLSKTLQLQREVKESKSFIADLSSMLGNTGEMDSSVLLENVENLNEEVTEFRSFTANLSSMLGNAGETNSSVLLENVENLKKGLSKSKAELDKLNIEKAEAEQQLAESNRKEDELRTENQRLHQKAESFKAELDAQDATINALQKEKEKVVDKYNQLKKDFNAIQESRKRHKQEAEILKTNLEDLSSKQQSEKEYYENVLQQNNDLILSLAEKNKELNISKYMDEINFQRIKNLSEGNAMLTSQRDMKYLNEKLNHQKMELREDVYFRLQELKEKEWFLDQFLAIEKNLTDFLNTIILYKKNMSISEILEKITGGYRKEAKVLDEELLKQDFKGKLNNLFAKKYTNIAEDYSYTKYTKNKIYETLRAKENKKVLNERYYEDTRTAVLRSINNMNPSFEEVKKSIDKKIPTIRKLREESVIKDFFEKISKIKYFRILMEYVDRHLDGNYEAISRVRTYKYDKK